MNEEIEPTTPPARAGLPVIQGRGATSNPPNRFERFAVEAGLEQVEGDEEYLDQLSRPATEYYVDSSRSIVATNDSPDVGFTHSINPYRGCVHGCVYCYARQTHEFLGFSAGLDFETRIMVKENAPELLRKELMNPRWEPVVLSISGVTDCYQPVERKIRLTRRCLEVLAEFRNPVGIVTKNHLVTRDADLLGELARFNASIVLLSVTTLDKDLSMVLEPRTSVPKRRLDAIETLTKAGVPCGVMVAPIIPGLTDHEVPAILKAAADAGARCASYVPLRLPLANKVLFEEWLARHFPDRKDKVLNRIRSLRGGKLNDSNFGSRMRGEGIWADQIKAMFELAERKAGLDKPFPELSTEAFRRPPGPQLTLW